MRLYGIQVPRGETWKAKAGRREIEELVDRMSGYRFCEPISNVPPPSGMIIVDSNLAAKKTLNNEGIDRDIRAWVREGEARLKSLSGVVFGNLPNEIIERDFTQYFLLMLLKQFKKVIEVSDVPQPFNLQLKQRYSQIVMAAALVPRQAPDLLQDIAQALWSGFFPLRYIGHYPNGVLEVFCPRDRPHRKTVSSATKQTRVAAVGAVEKVHRALQQRFREHPGFSSAKALRPTAPSAVPQAWNKLVADVNPGRAVYKHFAPLAITRVSRAALKRIAARVMSVAISRKTLVIHVRDDEGSAQPLRCSAPWTGAITHLPKDLIPLLRLHNGMQFGEQGVDPEIFPYDGEQFTGEVWYQIAPPPTEDPFSVVPLIAPVTDGQNLYIYHPTEPARDGSARLMQLSHETGVPEVDTSVRGCGKDGAGGWFLRLVDEQLTLDLE